MTAAVGTHSVGLVIRRVPGRALLLVIAVAAAYHYSLISLARGLALETPLAYLGLVPFIALALGWHSAVRRPGLSPYDLRLDFTLGRTLGLTLLIVAIAIATVVPRTSGLDFWLLRVDILSMPIFVAGVVAILYGVRRVWSLRFAILFLLLAWPAPYLELTASGMAASVNATVVVLSAISAVVPLATPVGGSDGLFLIGSGPSAIPVSVASACSGLNSVVGFGIVGVSLFAILRGPLVRRVAWLAAGLALTWALNVLRIEFIFAAGTFGSPQLALNVLHPVAGLLVFNVGLLIMLLMAGRFGLRIGLGDNSPPSEWSSAVAPRGHRLAGAVAVVLAASLGMAIVNASYAGFQPLGGDQGIPRITGFEAGRAWVPEWSSKKVAEYQHGRQFFGPDSTWTRSVYSPVADATMRANVPVYVDVITTNDAAALAGYSVEACYSFHGYVVESTNQVVLSEGLAATMRSYADPRGSTDWTILSWEWPIQQAGSVRYQRVVLLLPDGDSALFAGISDTNVAEPSRRFGEAEHLLANLARTMVANQLASEVDGSGA